MLDDDTMVGRSDEQLAILRVLEAADRGGGALIIRGAPGLGKTKLLDWADELASSRHHRVLRAAGTASEFGLPFAALHRILWPVLGFRDRLPDPRRRALDSALGLSSDGPPVVFGVAMAVLDLVADVATTWPVVIVADDVQWIDEASAQVLAFLARRLGSDRIVLLAAVRDNVASPLLEGAGDVLDLAPLDALSCVELVHRSNAALDDRTRELVLAVSAGNPLALLELPKSLASLRGQPHPGDWLPLTVRLERSFADRIDELPDATRYALQVAALNDSDDVLEVIAAVAALDVSASDRVLDDAVRAGLLVVGATTFRFVHPLVRSAVYQHIDAADRRATHAALAGVLADRPERATWHRAAAAVTADDLLADALESVAQLAIDRGAASAAVSALERSAQLSAEPSQERRRLFRAASLAYELGDIEVGDRTRTAFHQLVYDRHDQLRFEWLSEVGASERGDESRVRALIRLAERAYEAGDLELTKNFLGAAASRCWNLYPDRASGREVIAAAKSLAPGGDRSWRALLLAYGAPFERAGEVIGLVREGAIESRDASTSYRLGHAAACVGAFDISETLFSEATDGLRTEGRLATLAPALVLHSWSAMRRGKWPAAVSAAEEGERLADETDQPFWLACAYASHSMVTALRGNVAAAESLVVAAERVAAPHQFAAAAAVILIARAAAAASEGNHERAFGHLVRLHQPTDVAYHPVHGLWSLAGLAEAAVRCGQRERARRIVDGLRDSVIDTASPAGQMNLRYAKAVLADEDEIERRLMNAVSADMSTWPFEHNRLLLTFGSWLRRRQRSREARDHLRSARDGFDRLGARPWAMQAREELRAAGERSEQPEPQAWDDLSPQETHIAAMVALGLSNKQIGERLFLSHRTIGSHLYRMFPKLGITSRIELMRLMAERSTEVS